MARLEIGGRPIRFNEVHALAQVLSIDLSGFGRVSISSLADKYPTLKIDPAVAERWALAMDRKTALETELAGLQAHLEWLEAAAEQTVVRLAEVRLTLATLDTFIQAARESMDLGREIPADFEASVEHLLGGRNGDR